MRIVRALLGVLAGLAALCLSAAPAAPAGKNLVDNPSFAKTGAGPVPDWTVRATARKTVFKQEGGRLVAVRGPGPAISADSVNQILYLPSATGALRVTVVAETDRALDARVVLRFLGRDGGALGHVALFRLPSSTREQTFEKDVGLPAGTKDVELSLEMHGEGRLVVEEVAVLALDADEVRPQARVVVVTGRAWLEVPQPQDDSLAELTIPIPPVTATQCPVSLVFETDPPGRVRGAKILRLLGRDTLALSIEWTEPGARVGVEWSARVVVTGREDVPAPPAPLPLVPARHLHRRLLPLTELTMRETAARTARGIVGDTKDLRVAMAAITARMAETGMDDEKKAAQAVRLLRGLDVPARQVALTPIGDTTAFGRGVLAFQKELGWLRFGVAAEDPVPLPCDAAVVVAAGGANLEQAPEAPAVFERHGCGLGEHEGPAGRGPFLAREVATIVIEKGAGPDLIAGLAKAWDRAVKAEDPPAGWRVARSKVSLSGKASRAKKFLPEILGKE